ncbi:MotA/TolQ/ExbB proton channel family protein [Alkalilimnicola sp. S0819]|nr:MotA/TolQ/ExbB proton channel family protein [Alkalilimnicola sp. S0819]MPQ15795.1 MotA/TolQ/ExbB proton channel family protein [Alkalilimnicola sp. S0819]
MLPIILCSILALAIVVERLWTLRRARIIPRHLVAQVWHQLKKRSFEKEQLKALRTGSPLGRILAAGLANARHDRTVMLESIEDVGRHEAHGLERYLNTLGTVAAITPLLGLLGTVIGMIKVFGAIQQQGLGNTAALAGGIGEALITTAAGLVVAVPALIAYRYLRGHVDGLIVDMEQEALKLVDALHDHRQPGDDEAAA